jgi:solute carrier family 25 phosphate transporter 23/24/25/41
VGGGVAVVFFWLDVFNSGIEIGDAELAAFVQHVDQDKNGIITFNEWRDFLWVYPQEVTLSNIYQYWEKVYLVDIGEGAVIPEGIGKHNTARYLLAGAVAGALSRTATAPLDRLKVLLQVQTNSAGVIAGLWHIYKQSGFMGFFRGNGINILKVAPESAIKFYSYEMMKRIVVGDGQHGEIGTWGRLSAGGIAGSGSYNPLCCSSFADSIVDESIRLYKRLYCRMFSSSLQILPHLIDCFALDLLAFILLAPVILFSQTNRR